VSNRNETASNLPIVGGREKCVPVLLQSNVANASTFLAQVAYDASAVRGQVDAANIAVPF